MEEHMTAFDMILFTMEILLFSRIQE